ncbi:SGNH/GDSL hydrolase family protein [Mucilaginibacter psychrotolerans]|uniref:Electron transporter RnfD n=1 Tax=Mucilaginibacter psychrotolerans TaxID=1524096 RepID=A0A4Y8SAN7_9SPHI|nr:SGNH/GDSL hydrolase family protein [Mucilaginibacter psychrotolerans]TFF35627.1 electron transporter RnfD [Mucilaginibacter psychrotolerans]
MKRFSIFHLIVVIGFCFSISCTAETVVSYSDPNIHYMGRVGIKNDAVELTWSASSVVINFEGTSAKATLDDNTGQDFVTVVVDDKMVNTIQLKKYKKKYELASGLPAGPHKLELFKRTEFAMGSMLFYSFTLNDSAKVLPPPTYKHRIEFYGNSITCGYAIEDLEGKDRGTYQFENGYKSYANITARHFNAEYYCIAKSGIGVTVSWFPYVMPDIYDRTNALDSTKLWDFSKYTPEVVVVNLFQNDSWILKQPDNAQFKAHFGDTPPSDEFIINAYQNFIGKIRGKYPDAKIVCALGAMDATKEGSPWPGYIKEAVKRMHDKGIYTNFFPYNGTGKHPNEAEQKVMAANLIKFIEKKFKW